MFKSFENVDFNDVSLKKISDDKEIHVKESAHEAFPTESSNTGKGLVKESFILQDLENKGVKNIPRVAKDANGDSYSQSGTLVDSSIGSEYIFASVGMEKLPITSLRTYEFPNDGELITAMISVAQTLKDIYEAGYVHDDLKPENLGIDERKNIYVLDFNLAKKVSPHGIVLAQSPEGTPPFNAPEKQINEYTVRSDIYSFAVIIAEKCGINTDLINEKLNRRINIPQTIDSFHNEVSQAESSGLINAKLAEFIKTNTSYSALYRLKNYDQVIAALKKINDPSVTDSEFRSFIQDCLNNN